jgi:hypothetical protein
MLVPDVSTGMFAVNVNRFFYPLSCYFFPNNRTSSHNRNSREIMSLSTDVQAQKNFVFYRFNEELLIYIFDKYVV